MSATRLGPGSTEETVIRKVDQSDRNGIIKEIKTALEKRSGKKWSVTGGKGTAYGWITVDAPPSRRTCHSRLKAGALNDWPESWEHVNMGESGGYITAEDAAELARLLGKETVHHQGESIPASHDHYREYLHRALYGNPGSFNAQPYWD